jgi:hypothetical protein
MKVGDLVNFHTSAWVFENANKDYANPGVVLEVIINPKDTTRFVAEIYWADGKITREYDSYLCSTREKNESR